MDNNVRFNHIEDILCRLHFNAGSWFSWSDPSNKIYANLIILDSDYDKPTEKSLTDALEKAQNNFDAQEYARNRVSAYDSVGDQLDQIMKDMRDGTTTHQNGCEAVKNKFPKP